MDKKYQIIYSDIQTFNQKYQNKGSINRGQYGRVDKIELLKHDEKLSNLNFKFAVKKLDCLNIPKLKQEREVLALQQVNLLPYELRKYIIKLYEQYWDPEEREILIVIPRAKTSFEKQILINKQEKQFYQASDLCYMLSCALLGLSTLDLLEIMHRDIKPLNMLIMEDGSLILADFGTAKQYNDKNTVSTGTPTYYSPEMLLNFSEKVDNNDDYYNKDMINVMKSCDLYGIGKTFVFAASLIDPPNYPVTSNDYKFYQELRDEYYQKAFGVIESQKILSPEFVALLKGMVNEKLENRYDLQTCLKLLQQLPDW